MKHLAPTLLILVMVDEETTHRALEHALEEKGSFARNIRSKIMNIFSSWERTILPNGLNLER